MVDRDYSLLDHIPVGVFLLDVNGVVLFWNSTLVDWTRISREQIVGQHIGHFFPRLIQSRYVSRLEDIFKGGPPTIFSAQLHRYIIPCDLGNGVMRIQHTTVTAVKRHGGGFDAMFSIQDVTDLMQRISDYRQMRDEALREVQERKLVELELAGSNERYRALSEMISDYAFAFKVSQDGLLSCEWVTDAFTQITGYERDGLSTLDDFFQIIHPDDVQDIKRVIQTIIDNQISMRLEHRIVTKYGEVKYIQSYFRPVVYSESNTVTRIYCAAQDITLRKLTENQLRESEARFRQIAEHIDAAIYIYDVLLDEIVYVNPQYRDFRDLAWSPLLQPNAMFWQIVHPEDRKTLQGLGKSNLDGFLSFVYRVLLNGDANQQRWIYIRMFPVVDSRGITVRFISLIEDVTQQKESEDQKLSIALEREQAKMLGAFITDASHEFRTPLSIINSSLYLSERVKDPVKRSEYLTSIRDQVQHITELVDRLLTMAGLDTEVTTEFESVDINMLVQISLEQKSAALNENNIQLQTSYDPALPRVAGRPTYLWQAFNALIDNAIRYSEPGLALFVETSLYEHNVRIMFKDTGSGISPEYLSNIFDRFFRADQAHTTRGFGLGLSIARKIVESHNGVIWAESEVGKGSRFYIQLPALNSQVENHLDTSERDNIS